MVSQGSSLPSKQHKALPLHAWQTTVLMLRARGGVRIGEETSLFPNAKESISEETE